MNEWGREGEGDMYNGATVAENPSVRVFKESGSHVDLTFN